MKELGIKELNELQKKTYPLIRSGKNVLIMAPTGSGKTEAAMFPLLHNLLEREHRGVALLYITPLRALNRDMEHRMKVWEEITGLRVGVRHGDTTQYQRGKQLRNPPHILITTPESFQSILAAEKMGRHLENVRYVVVDEVHELYAEKRGYQLSLGLERLVERAGEFQRIGLSATVGDPERAKRFLGGRREVVTVDVTHRKEYRFYTLFPRPTKEETKEAEEYGIPSETYKRIKTILEILSKHKQVITFVNTRSTAEQLSYYLKRLDESTEVHHSSLSRDIRLVVEKLLRSGEVKHVIATSSLELGIDIGNVDAVIQYGSPRQVIRLLQRVGRAGHRWDEPSVGYLIALDWLDREEIEAIVKKAYEGFIEPPSVEESPLDVLAHQVAGIVLDRGEITLEELYSIVRRAYPFFRVRVDELEDVVIQLDKQRLLRYEEGKVRKSRQTRIYYYTNLSMIPDEQKFFVVYGRKNVAMLDEEFVSDYLDPGVTFVTGGNVWRVIAVDGRNVIVEPAPPGTPAIPAWIGEQIPVYPEIAEEVMKRLEEERGIEVEGSFVVVKSFLGSRGNAALARIIAGEMERRYDIYVRVYSSPYVVIVEFPSTASGDIVKEVIEEISPSMVDVLIERYLTKSTLFRGRFLHVARRFGLISRDATLDRVGIRRLLSALSDSPIYRETLKEIIAEKLDLEAVKSFVGKSYPVRTGLSKLSKKEIADILTTPDIIEGDPKTLVRNVFKNKVMGKRVYLLCVHCGSWKSKKVGEVKEEDLVCYRCGSPLVAPVFRIEEAEEMLEKKKGKDYEALIRRAELTKVYGKRAVIALTVEGVGPKTADRILSIPLSEEEFWDKLIEAEREYVRNRIFWKT